MEATRAVERRIVSAYFAVVRETIGRHGGLLERFVGDAAMAVSGAPRVRDDDAERAVRAALALVAAVERLGAPLGDDDGVQRALDTMRARLERGNPSRLAASAEALLRAGCRSVAAATRARHATRNGRWR